MHTNIGFTTCLWKKGSVEESCVGGLVCAKISHTTCNSMLCYLNVGAMALLNEQCFVLSCDCDSSIKAIRVWVCGVTILCIGRGEI